MAPVDPGAQGNEQGNTSPSVPGAKTSQAPALRLPQGGLAAVFSAAFSTPEALPGVAEILRDDEFLEALSRTVSFLSDIDRDDGVQSPRRAVQALHRLESVDAVRSVGRSLLLGCAELFANRRLYLELPSPVAGGQPTEVAHETRLHRLCTYLTHITNLIQDGASQFQEPTLWKIIDDEFIARIHPPLAQELNQLYRLDTGSTTAVLTVFERLDECAQSLETVTGENRQIISLLAGFILRRLTFALNSLKAPEVRSAEDSGLRDRIAEKLAHKLGTEIEQYRTKKSAPLMHLLREANGEGYGFIKGVFSGFFRLHGDIFRRKNAWSAETAERQSRLIQGYETLGACASILWPAEFSGYIRENFSALDPYHRAAALQILQYAVSDDPRSIEFALRESIRLLGHGALIVRDDVCRVLSNFAEPLAHLLSSAASQDDDARTLIRKYQQSILEKVFVPLAQRGDLSSTLKGALAPLLVELVREQGAAVFRSFPSLGRLLTWEACKKLDAKERQKLVLATMEAYAQEASGGLHGDRVFAPNRDREEPTAALLTALGPQGLFTAFQYSSELTRTGNRVGALAVRLAAARAAREFPDIEWSAVDKAAYASLVFGDVFAALHDIVQRKLRLIRGSKSQTTQNPTSTPVTPELRDDLDHLVNRALARQTVQGSLPDSVLNDPPFVFKLAELEGEVLCNALKSPLMTANRLPDFLKRLSDNELQMILAQSIIETRFQVPPETLDSVDKRVAKLIEFFSASPLKQTQRSEFQQVRRFVVEEIEQGRLSYTKTPELNRILGGILERALRESLLGSREVYPFGDEELHLAVDVFAAHTRRGHSDAHHACRRFLACWFKVFPAAERHRHVRVSMDQVGRVVETVIEREGDSDWAGKAVYLLSGKLESLLQASRNSKEALERDVVPMAETLRRCAAVIGSEREVAFEKAGVSQRHNIQAVAFRVLEEVQLTLKPKDSSRPPPTPLERIPRIPFEYRPGARVHVPGLPSVSGGFLGSSDNS